MSPPVSMSSMGPPANAAILPAPGGPSVVGVLDHTYPNAVSQDVLLRTDAATPGQNALQVRFLGLGSPRGDDALQPRPLDEAALAAEMRAALPGISMRTAPLYVQNLYGPFGYAVGSGVRSDLCVYAWQNIADPTPHPFQRPRPIEVRLRICQRGGTEQALLATMYSFTISGRLSPGWIGATLPPTMAHAGMPVYPWPQATPLPPAPKRHVVARQVEAPAPVMPVQGMPAPVTPAPLLPTTTALPAMPIPMPPAPQPAALAGVVVPPPPTLTASVPQGVASAHTLAQGPVLVPPPPTDVQVALPPPGPTGSSQ